MTEPTITALIGVREAIAILDQLPVSPRTQWKPLRECADHVLAEDVPCDRPFPPFDKAVMDGYAVRAADITAGATLHCQGSIAAGRLHEQPITAGQVIAIMTGAPLPGGADAVVPIEHTTREGDLITFHQSATMGQSIARMGHDRSAGEIIARKGSRIGPAFMGALAAVGCARPLVFCRPTVAILPTGDELVAIDQIPTGAMIRNSNAILLGALVKELGCDVIEMPPCADEPALLQQAIKRGLEHDALLITGGMSMGERDYVPAVLEQLGLRRQISKLRIKPGKPFVLATDGPRIAFGLPGNPVSAFLCTLRLASRVLRRMAGETIESQLPRLPLAELMPPNGPREFYQPGRLTASGSIQPLNWRGSADLFTLVSASVFVVRPENAPAAVAGELVDVLWIP